MEMMPQSIKYLMQNDMDCGFRLVSALTQKPVEEFRQKWGWEDYNDFRDNLLDSHWHHFDVLEQLQIPYMKRTFQELIEGRCKNEKTGILIHANDSPYLSQHWVQLKEVTNNCVEIYFGDDTIRKYTFDQMRALNDVAWPRIIYTVDEGNHRITWYQRMYVNLTRKVLKRRG